MHIRGADKARCEICVHMKKSADGEKLICNLTQSEASAENSCPKFKYDIFKYKGADKAKIGKFKKEDFLL